MEEHSEPRSRAGGQELLPHRQPCSHRARFQHAGWPRMEAPSGGAALPRDARRLRIPFQKAALSPTKLAGEMRKLPPFPFLQPRRRQAIV